MELSPEQVCLLSKADLGLRQGDETRDYCDELRRQGLLDEHRTILGRRRLRLTENGRRELLKARHSASKVVRSIASGVFDHLPFPLVQQLISSPDLERYIESQLEVQRLILLHQLDKTW